MKAGDCSISDLLKVLEYSEQRSAEYVKELDRRCLQWGISIVDGHLNIDGRFSVRDGVAEVGLPAAELHLLIGYLLNSRK